MGGADEELLSKATKRASRDPRLGVPLLPPPGAPEPAALAAHLGAAPGGDPEELQDFDEEAPMEVTAG